jgi:alpha-glucosidase (family GH31 glycosyl hydrolase)
VWWTGDSVQLDAAVQSMVDSGVHAMKPYVHSDCGGDGVVHGDVAHLRWTAHCVLGTILRFHGADHRPWHDGAGDNVTVKATEDTVRQYLQMRYRLVPSLVAAAHEATQHAFPLVSRLDLFHPVNKTKAEHRLRVARFS